MKLNWRPLSLKSWHFEAIEDIMPKFKLQIFHVIRIKYWNAGGSGNPPSLIPTLWNIGILLHKQATQTKHFDGQCNKNECVHLQLHYFKMIKSQHSTHCVGIVGPHQLSKSNGHHAKIRMDILLRCKTSLNHVLWS